MTETSKKLDSRLSNREIPPQRNSNKNSEVRTIREFSQKKTVLLHIEEITVPQS